MNGPTVVVVGDLLLDRDVEGRATRLSPDAPVPVVDVEDVLTTPGGAGLAALLCAGAADTILVAPVSHDDPAGRELAGLLGPVRVHAWRHRGATRTKTRIRAGGQTLLRVDDGGPGEPLDVDAGALARVLDSADTVLVSDYGGGVTRDDAVRAALAEYAKNGVLVWDPHPRGGPPVSGCALVTPNLAEAVEAVGGAASTSTSTAPAELAAGARDRWRARAVAVTVGRDGAHLDTEHGATHVPAKAVVGHDPCGAGDRFASAAAVALARGASVEQAVAEAVASAARWVADGGASAHRRGLLTPPHPAREACADDGPDARGPSPEVAVIPLEGNEPASPPVGAPEAEGTQAPPPLADVRAGGGTVVATGGCFDLLHVGHVRSLAAARELGDCLVVLLNSDASVRRLKGPGRPAVTAAERAEVLRALGCVDAVVVFEEDDPRAALARIRPDVWVKGGDYAPDDLPEAPLVRSWGGRVEVVPFVPGRSSTALVEGARRAP